MDLKGRKIAVIIAHPDDETIGCGGLLAKAASQKADCRVVLPVKRADSRGVIHWDSLLQQFNRACAHLGATPCLTDELVEDLTAEMSTQKICSLIHKHVEWADIILTHWRGDTHQAHQAVARAVELATRPFRNPRTVLCFEIPTSTDQGFTTTFSPNCFVTLSESEMNQKKEAMRQYETELVAGRTPGNLELQMRVRGSQIGVDFGEAYVIARYFM